MSMRRLTRVTNAFSKKLENLNYVLALHLAYYLMLRKSVLSWNDIKKVAKRGTSGTINIPIPHWRCEKIKILLLFQS